MRSAAVDAETVLLIDMPCIHYGDTTSIVRQCLWRVSCDKRWTGCYHQTRLGDDGRKIFLTANNAGR
ncbi:hypothetical protein KCP69_21965 [Salmonella enterica subsp. enterica]|nr:hypothetical protein KCP69_21965 [Salmonella enterica subsp. enterica]